MSSLPSETIDNMDTNNKKQFTEEERLQLAEKLDKELDEFINGLEKKRYQEGWPEDRWQEEMAKHPFFMKEAPKPGDELHPLLEGIQQLKYDPNENTKDDLAINYKEDGIFYMKHKKYRMAILSFTEGIKIKCDNNEINANLYNNRSAAQFFLKNYRSSLLDAKKALELKPNYQKAKLRAAKCAFNTHLYDEAINYYDQMLNDDPTNESIQQLMKEVKQKKKEYERDERKHLNDQYKHIQKLFKTLDEIKKRNNIKFEELHLTNKRELTEDILQPKYAPLEDFPVKLNNYNSLIWPTAFSYPEFLFSDFHQEINENEVVEDIINDMFKKQIECDKEYKYKPNNLSVYYENRIEATVHKVDLQKTFRDVIEEENFYIIGGSLLFYIVPKDSDVEKKFLNELRRPLINMNF